MIMGKFHNVSWTKNDIIRHKMSGKPYKVIHVYTGIATMMVDMTYGGELTTAEMLFPRDYISYAKDKDFECKKKQNDELQFKYKPLVL